MIVFHRILISTAIVFCLGLSAWAIVSYQDAGEGYQLALGISFGIAGLGLGYYLKNLRRFLGR